MTNDLDTRARAGARALHEAVASRAGPRHGSHPVAASRSRAGAGGGRRRRRRRGHRTGDEGRGRAAPQHRPLRRRPPPRARPAAARPGGHRCGGPPRAGRMPACGAPYWVYGDASAADPFEEGDLGLVHLSSESLHLDREGAAGVEVDGHPAWVANEPDAATGLRSVVVELDGSSLGLLSATLGDDELLAAAGDLDLDAVALDPPDRLAGLEQVGVARGCAQPRDRAASAPHRRGPPRRVRGRRLRGHPHGDRGVRPGRRRHAGRRPLGARRHRSHRRGAGRRRMVGLAYLGAESPMLVWQESPGVVVTMAGYGVDEATLLAAAESIRTADRGRVDRPRRALEHGDRPRRRAVGVVERGDDGRRVRGVPLGRRLPVRHLRRVRRVVQSEACGGAARSASLLVSDATPRLR